MAFLELGGVCKGYGANGSRTEVLQDINLEIEQGEFVAIVGFSGAGKTTLISMIAGLLPPDRGTIRLDGKEIRQPGPDRGVVFQNYSLLPWKSVYGNIHLAVEQAFPKWTRAQKEDHTERHIALVNLTPARNKKPGELSGGMRQRVALARALAMDPSVLLMDEPLGALDALTRATLQDEIVRIWERNRKTVVLITNDVDEGILLADRIIPLSHGPRATLGPSVVIDLPRPRDRKALNHSPRFQRIRGEVIDYLLGSRRVARPESSKGVRGSTPFEDSGRATRLPAAEVAP
jgi:nitrate/nitrite transport system ATP-binding protein